ncbi:MAG: Smr/MutS family protein [Acidobacteriota bacterium]
MDLQPAIDDAVPSSASAPLAATVSAATESALEFPALRALIAAATASDLGAEQAEALRPFDDLEALETRRRRYDEARRLIAARPLVPSPERPLRPILRSLAGSLHDLDGRAIVEVGALLDATTGAIERVRAADPACEALAERVEPLADLDDLRRHIRRTFDGRGEIREDATPRLAALRGKIRSSRQVIYDQLGKLVEEHKDHLSEDTIPMRGGRMVLMLQSGAKGRVQGLVHGRSATGRSFYFEPLEAVDANNDLQQAVEDEEAEKRRILADTVERLRTASDDLLDHADLLGELDLLQASVRFAERAEGRLAELSERHDLRLVGARHPLLDPRLGPLRRSALGTPGHVGDVVPLDLSLDAEGRALVLTGPNAGGKTVTLKTLGLLVLAHQCGLPVPVAQGTRLPFFDAVVATVGDDQDLLTDRSTFSGRLLRLREAWEAAGPDALILLDELGSGTDPEEGAALSTALLEGLLDSRALVLITTHLSQVAASALEADGAFCAAMQFDASSGEPTYRMMPGPPGGSEALALAHRLGLPTRWLERAEELLGSEHRQLRRMLAELERHRQDAVDTRRTLESELADAETLRRRLAERESELRAEKDSLGKTMRRRLDAFRQETRQALRKEVERLRAEAAAGRTTKGLATKAEQRLFESAPVFTPPAPVEEGPVEVGATVRHRGLGWTGTLEKLERGRAQVSVGGKLLVCKEKDLVGAAGGDDGTGDLARSPFSKALSKTAARRAAAIGARSRGARPDLLHDAPARELNLIGQRVEPALVELDRYLDRALMASLASIRIVHGHGTGRLRDAVRAHLDSHPAVAGQRAGKRTEGGDGATVVELAV